MHRYREYNSVYNIVIFFSLKYLQLSIIKTIQPIGAELDVHNIRLIRVIATSTDEIL